MRFDIVTLFPGIFEGYLNESIIYKAREQKLIDIKIHDLRDYTEDKHRTVDDKPYGGGPGMILKIEPIYKCLSSITDIDFTKQTKRNKKEKIIMLDPAGETFDQKKAYKFSKLERIIFLCGRYEGFDYRATKLVDERISIGNYVLSGGEIPSLVILEAVTRLVPGVISHQKEILKEETFSIGKNNDFVEYPQFTRPEIFNPQNGINWQVPKVLLSGNHQKIKKWRMGKVKGK